jgi:ribosomal protein S18 acetylase RimI-like enzyme
LDGKEFLRLSESELLSGLSGLVIRVATIEDAAAISLHDKHVSADLLEQKIDSQEAYVAYDDDVFAGWLRYSLFKDNTPFMNMLFLLLEYRSEGIGRQLTLFWEEQMKEQGYKALMSSTQRNESAQHFYSHMGYQALSEFALPGRCVWACYGERGELSIWLSD